MTPENLLIIAKVDNEDSNDFELIYFMREGSPYIPMFSNAEEFERETAGTEYMHQGWKIDTRLLGALLESEYPIILDPWGGDAKLLDRNSLLGIGS